ncbi:MAG: hypothetical protein Q9O62_12195 [Ardenticatenia bacterium]|nr:hypothetical protein [Ardenticatenia bacterium]
MADYPRIDGQLHAEYNMQILRGFRSTWRPSLFCVCMWLVEIYEPSNYAFANAAWWYNKIAGSAYPESILPAVHALRREPKFVRHMPWEAQPDPAPEVGEIQHRHSLWPGLKRASRPLAPHCSPGDKSSHQAPP